MLGGPAASDRDSPRVAEPDATLTRLISEHVLDGELAGLLWLLLTTDLGLVVSGRPQARPERLAAALEGLPEAASSQDGHARRQLWLLAEDSLEHVFARLAGPPTNLSADQQRSVGLVLIVRHLEGRGQRLAAAHYVRPLERDAGGHLQRRPPALLAARDEDGDRLEHFAWGITAELADRLGRTLPDFEAGHRRREQLLERLVQAGALDHDALRRAAGELAAAEGH